MRRLVRALSRRMLLKVFAVTSIAVGVALLLLAVVQTREQEHLLERATGESAEHLADLVAGSVEHAMLQGDGITVTELIAGFKTRVPMADIRVYDRRGLEVFGVKAPPPASLPPELDAAFAARTRRTAGTRVLRPIPNEERCWQCHQEKDALRGLLVLDRRPEVLTARRGELAATLVTDAFIHVMTARKADGLDDYFQQVSQLAPSVAMVAVYDREGDLAYGKDVAVLPRGDIASALVAGAKRRTLPLGDLTVELVPLARESWCGSCHKDKAPVRGVLAVALARVPAGDAAPEQELEGIVDASVRAMMVASLGRIISEFLDQVSATGAFASVDLYDPVGRHFYASAPPPPDAVLATALAMPHGPTRVEHKDGMDWVLIPRRLDNGARCQVCHGADAEVRGLVTVQLPNQLGPLARHQAITRTAAFAGVALVLVLLLLWGVLRVLVVRPVAAIASTAAAVGRGDLGVRVHRADPNGDEMNRLGTSINEMIQGLRAKLMLEKFVSKGASAAAAMSGSMDRSRLAVNTAGERRALAILFSDIRGFTAYSETVPPEQVVAMLNVLLRVQADVVERHGGDVDKFVGDELMAVFDGADAPARAVRCAVEMIEAVDKARLPGQTLAVGVGVSHGEVVYGPIGSASRLDFTVIGDVVNTGARLCSAAAGGEVMVTRAVVDGCRGGLGDVEFNAREPMKVKGKREPLEVYGATRVR